MFPSSSCPPWCSPRSCSRTQSGQTTSLAGGSKLPQPSHSFSGKSGTVLEDDDDDDDHDDDDFMRMILMEVIMMIKMFGWCPEAAVKLIVGPICNWLVADCTFIK